MAGKNYWLKRATPRMKYTHMNHTMQERAVLKEQLDREADRVRLAREVNEIETEADLTRRCILLEGEKAFYKWWDDDTQVPPFGLRKDRIKLIEKRILELSKHEGSVPNEQERGTKSQEKDQEKQAT